MNDFRKSIRKAIKDNPSPSPKRNLQSLILTGLNVLQVLEEQPQKYLQNFLHYGPASYTGTGWAAALIWYRPMGYHEYQELTLFGTWATTEEEKTTLIVATKVLAFSAPVFNPESYHAIIKTTFKPYYNDNASPPSADNILFQTPYEETRRLALRRELADAIIQNLRLHKR